MESRRPPRRQTVNSSWRGCAVISRRLSCCCAWNPAQMARRAPRCRRLPTCTVQIFAGGIHREQPRPDGRRRLTAQQDIGPEIQARAKAGVRFAGRVGGNFLLRLSKRRRVEKLRGTGKSACHGGPPFKYALRASHPPGQIRRHWLIWPAVIIIIVGSWWPQTIVRTPWP